MSDQSWISDSEPYIRPRPGGSANAWTDEAARHGRRGGQKTLQVATLPPPVKVAEALRLEPDSLVVVRRRLILLDEVAVELSDSYYPASIAVGTRLADSRKIPGGAVKLLADLGFLSEVTVEQVHAATATESQATHLGLAPGSAVLTLVRTSSTAEDVPFEVSIMTMPSDRHLTYRLAQGASRES
ncbi:GntR family transcriptional regulator [Streptomyces sp. NPDC057242]|uniref:GntR family transcriptional regulator n=1 Tax=unclassified Streptomyces TaxID=2593676 RepID=UPI0036337356